MKKKISLIILLFLTIFVFVNVTDVKSKTNLNPRNGIIDIIMYDSYFSPASIDIQINETVTFNLTNVGVNIHTFTLDNPSFGIDVSLDTNQHTMINFTTPQTAQIINFHCVHHAQFGMTGSINVFDPNSTSSSSTTSSSSYANYDPGRYYYAPNDGSSTNSNPNTSNSSTTSSVSTASFNFNLLIIALISSVIILRSRRNKS